MDCPFKYYVSYELDIKSEAIHLDFGNLVHTVLERYFKYEGDDILELYDEEWQKGKVPDYQYYIDGKNMLLDFISKHDRNEIMTIETEHEFNIELTPAKVDKDCPNCKGKGFISEEEPCECYLPPVTVRGFIDRVDELDKDTILVTDYKTSRVPLTEAEADSDFQLSMYYMAIRKLYPEYKNIILSLYYLREGLAVTTTRPPDFLNDFEQFVINLFYQIYRDKDHEPRINKYCGWCDGRSLCPAYKELIERGVEFLDLESMDWGQLTEELETVKNSLKILESRKEELESIIKEELKYTDSEKLVIGDKEWYFASGKRSNYTLDSVIKAIPNEWHKCVTIRKTEVDKIVGKNEKIKSFLENEAEYYYVTPSLRSRKIRKARGDK